MESISEYFRICTSDISANICESRSPIIDGIEDKYNPLLPKEREECGGIWTCTIRTFYHTSEYSRFLF
jgi:hypothetical protein